MKDLKKLFESYKPHTYQRVKRGTDAYNQSYNIALKELTRLVKEYNEYGNEDQHARLLRDSIDHWIRRYHGYAIEGSIKAHYRERGVDIKNCIFEHILPLVLVRDLLIQGLLSVDQALNPPTCLVSKETDQELRNQGLVSSTPDIYYFFRRYSSIDIDIETVDGKEINPNNWNLDKHYKTFKLLK